MGAPEKRGHTMPKPAFFGNQKFGKRAAARGARLGPAEVVVRNALLIF